VGALTSRNPMGLHGLEQGYLYFYLLYICKAEHVTEQHSGGSLGVNGNSSGLCPVVAFIMVVLNR
jgi:hypothetical protein